MLHPNAKQRGREQRHVPSPIDSWGRKPYTAHIVQSIGVPKKQVPHYILVFHTNYMCILAMLWSTRKEQPFPKETKRERKIFLLCPRQGTLFSHSQVFACPWKVLFYSSLGAQITINRQILILFLRLIYFYISFLHFFFFGLVVLTLKWEMGQELREELWQ